MSESRGRLARVPGGVVVAAGWVATQAVLALALGVRTGGDSGRYLEGARALLHGAWPEGKAASYLGYEAFVALVTAAGLGLPGIVAVQVLLGGLAVYGLHRLAARLYDARTATLAAFLFATYPGLQRWHYYLLTESLFVSTAVVAGALLTGTRGWAGRVGGWALVLFAATVRPHGVVLVAASALAAIYAAWRARRHALAAVLAVAALAVLPAGGRLVGRLLQHEAVLTHYVTGAVIWGYDGLTVPLPRDRRPELRPGADPVTDILAFAVEHPGHVARLAALRIGFEYAQARPYYSALHNAFLLATLLPAYAAALWGLRRPVAEPVGRIWLAAVVAFQGAAVALTFADWDGRHQLVVLPAVFLWAAAGIGDLRDRLGARRGAGRDRGGGDEGRVGPAGVGPP